MKRNISLLLALILALSAVLTLTSVASAEWIVYSAAANKYPVRVREAPTTKSKKMGTLKYGEEAIAVYDENSEWTCIKWQNTFGYVMSIHLSDVPPAPKKAAAKISKKQATELLRTEMKSERLIEEPFNIAVIPTRTSGYIPLRSGPANTTARVERLRNGKELIVISETDNWYCARDPENNKVGYIQKEYTSKLETQVIASRERLAGSEESIGRLSVNGDFDLTCKLPETYSMQVINVKDSAIYAAITSSDITRPELYMTIAYDDTYDSVERMNDLPEEDLKALEETFSALDEVEVSYTETAHGTKLLVCKENDGDGDTEYVQILTVYRGYLIEFDMETSEDAAEKSLTDEQIQMCIDFLSNLDFVEVKS